MLVDKADRLSLTIPEMIVLVGGMRALGANAAGMFVEDLVEASGQSPAI